MLRRWAIRGTDRAAPRVLTVGLVLLTVWQATAVRWHDPDVMSGVMFGAMALMLIGLAEASALRKVIDDQSKVLAETGRQTIPAARAMTPKDELKYALIAALIFFALFLMSGP